MAITDLPQLVAAFHSLVGGAAMAASVASYMGDPNPDLLHSVAAFAGTAIGGVTLTGSMVAFGKLQGIMKSAPLNLPGKNFANAIMGLGTAGAGALVATTGDPAVGVAALGGAAALSSALGWHMTASIGGADMPVVVTLLNSYSGWALCAEAAGHSVIAVDVFPSYVEAINSKRLVSLEPHVAGMLAQPDNN
jgi:NAD(P) transhydrogenase